MTDVSRLRDRLWRVSYSHEDGDLVHLFYLPALERGQLYQRVTGYFSLDVLALAARGLDRLIAAGGSMQLIVGCTLHSDEIAQIEKGYSLRQQAAENMLRGGLALTIDDRQARDQLGALAWMVAKGLLDIKVAIPLDGSGKMKSGLGLYHAKVGILTDSFGDKLVFKGSINETPAGWRDNCEAFDVNCSWTGGTDTERVEIASTEFARLWANQAKSACVVEVPDAVKEELLKYLPIDDTFVKPPQPEGDRASDCDENQRSADEPLLPVAGRDANELRRLVWAYIRDAPKRPDGAMVAVATSTVAPWPHQLRAYKRMLDSWPFRLLLADEVGLGKTIEAGLIIRHLWISQTARRILILAPKGLLEQWQGELYEKFNLLVPIYSGSSFVWPRHHFAQTPREEKIGRSEWTSTPLVLASSHLMRRADRQRELLDAADWDLVVLDEAHHARRRGAGSSQEKGPNRLLSLMQRVQAKTKGLLLMTATPMQVDPVEIWDLLVLLGLPAAWTEHAFLDYFDSLARNPDAPKLQCLARLFQESEHAFGALADEAVDRVGEKFSLSGIDCKKVMSALRDPVSQIPLKRLTVKQRSAALAVLKAGSPVRHRMSRHTRTLLREYYRRGLLPARVAERRVSDLAIEMSKGERELYERVEEYIAKTYQAAEPARKTAVGFVMTVYRRRIASSFYALRKTLEHRLQRLTVANGPSLSEALEDAPQDERSDEMISDEEALTMADEALPAEEEPAIQGMLRDIAKLGTDSKARRLVDELRKLFKNGYDAAIVFTQYTDTMNYLREHLAEQLNVRIGCYSGKGGLRQNLGSDSWSACSKEDIKRLLRTREVQILVCTDAAGEGLNLQTCGALINYDLPWNPMKVEQRIGRIDRIGQQFAEIQILNLGYTDTVETDVYFALSKRIGLFTGVVGKLQPILAHLPRQFEAAALAPSDQRERARHEARSNVEQLVTQAEQAGFDIDEVSERDMVPPALPQSPLTPEDLDLVFRTADLLPPGVECRELEPSTYALRLPGNSELARVTTSPTIFDEHFESHQLMAADSPLFRRLSAEGEADTVQRQDGHGSKEVRSLAELLRAREGSG